MKILIAILALCVVATVAEASGIRWVNGYTRGGSYVSGHYRDCSNDGNPYNNANYLGYNN